MRNIISAAIITGIIFLFGGCGGGCGDCSNSNFVPPSKKNEGIAVPVTQFDQERFICIDRMKMSDKEYFSIDALSNSDFRLLKESVVHYLNKDLFPIESPSLALGSAVHKLILEPETFKDDFVNEDFEGAELNKK